MALILFFMLLGAGLGPMVTGERHSLTYIYTGTINLSGVHEFMAMGLLNNRTIDYYDSTTGRRVPKQPGLKEHCERNLSADYWEKGTETRKTKETWFKENIKTLMERMRQNNSDVHVLQWQHGCEGEEQPNGTLKFTRAIHSYNYDNNNFIYFDDPNKVWVALSTAARATKRKFDGHHALRDYTVKYLENVCMKLLRVFVEYEKEELQRAERPKVYLFVKKSNIKTNMVLTCLATGFLPKEIKMRIKREGRVLSRADGINSTGSRPNGDNTFQWRDDIEVFRDDLVKYECEVSHAASGLHVKETLDMRSLQIENSESHRIVGVVVGILVLLAVLVTLAVLLKKKATCQLRRNTPATQECSLPRVAGATA